MYINERNEEKVTLSSPCEYSLADIERGIAECKRLREHLRQSLMIFKSVSLEGRKNINNLELDAQKYLHSLVEIQKQTETAFDALLNIPPERRYVIAREGGLIRKDQYQEELINTIFER